MTVVLTPESEGRELTSDDLQPGDVYLTSSEHVVGEDGVPDFARHRGITSISREQPTPEPPTEPGYWVGYDQIAECPILVVVRPNGEIFLPDAARFLGLGLKLGDPERFAPFTLLAPRDTTRQEALEDAAQYVTGVFGRTAGKLYRAHFNLSTPKAGQ